MTLIILGAIAAVVLLVIFWAIGTYNSLVRHKNLLQEALSGIAVQQKRRHDLIPNLVNTVKGYSIHEKDVLENVTKFRTSAMQSNNPHEQASAEDGLSGTLKTLFAVAENYPELKANENFLSLQKELSGIENDMQLARRYFNGSARNYNTLVLSFPTSLIANQFSFTQEEYFTLTSQAEANVPEVKF